MFHHCPSLGGVVDVSPYRSATALMIVSPPRAAQNVSAAPSSEDRSMLSKAWRSVERERGAVILARADRRR